MIHLYVIKHIKKRNELWSLFDSNLGNVTMASSCLVASMKQKSVEFSGGFVMKKKDDTQ